MNTVPIAHSNFMALLERSERARIAAAAALVLITLLVRLVLDPVLQSGSWYQLFYPAVLVSAYMLGARAALLAVLFSGLGVYFLFATPIFQVKTTLHAHLPLFFFLISSAVAIFVLSHVRERLRALTESVSRIDALTQSQAALFRDHAERVSDHLQLISALLQVHARDEGEPQLSRVLMSAAHRTMLISRMHRAYTSNEGEVIDFAAFAGRLAEAALIARDRPPITVSIGGDPLKLPLEQATSLGLVLLECLNESAVHREPGAMRVSLTGDADAALFTVVDERAGGSAEAMRENILMRAVAEQMRGTLVTAAQPGSLTLRLTFPRMAQPLPAWSSLQPLH